MPDLTGLSDYLWHHPEYSFHEFKACKAMSELLMKYDFQVETGVGGLETSVRGVYDSGKPGLNVGLLVSLMLFRAWGMPAGIICVCLPAARESV